MNDAVSHPPNANVSTDQKIMSLKCVLGIMECSVNEVADPKRCHATKPITMTIPTGIHIAIAPTLCSHLPISSPTIFNSVAALSVSREKTM